MIYLLGFYLLAFTFILIDLVITAFSVGNHKVIFSLVYMIFYLSFIMWTKRFNKLYLFLAVFALVLYQFLPIYYFDIPETYETSLYERVIPYFLLLVFYSPSFISVYLINRKKEMKQK